MPENKLYTDIAVIGGGAAGLMAAVRAASTKKGLTVTVFEKEARVGRKLLATGNGRCNLSNQTITNACYFGSAAVHARPLFKTYTGTVIADIWRELGLFTRSDESGRIYPHSNSAASVLDVLRLQMEHLGVAVFCNTAIHGIEKTKDGTFIFKSGAMQIQAKKLILTTGGKASSALGSDGSGYALLSALGHTVTPLFPSLAPVFVKEPLLPSLKGQRVICRVRLFFDDVCAMQEDGEVQFTEKALSGICMFQLSRRINEYFARQKTNGFKNGKPVISIDLFPHYTVSELFFELRRRATAQGQTLRTLLTGMLHSRVAAAMYKKSGLTGFDTNALGKRELSALASLLKDWRVYPCALSDFRAAQVTAGGVPGNEIHFETMQSKCCENLYFAGEIVDIDGLCGGYNLHWAWVSALLAGDNAAQKL